MLKSVEGNFDDPEVHKLLTKHFVELRDASPEGSAHVCLLYTSDAADDA